MLPDKRFEFDYQSVVNHRLLYHIRPVLGSPGKRPADPGFPVFECRCLSK
jgi:hypothetical protein